MLKDIAPELLAHVAAQQICLSSCAHPECAVDKLLKENKRLREAIGQVQNLCDKHHYYGIRNRLGDLLKNP